MAIEARCPNGHKIVCPDNRAGRSAKCPRCGARFRIPEPDRAAETQPQAPSNGRPQPEDNSTAASAERPLDQAVARSVDTSAAAGDPGANSSAAGEIVFAAAPRLESQHLKSFVAAPAPGPDEDLATTAPVLAGGSSPSSLFPPSPTGTDPALAAPGEETFLFLCPQGHRLHGPARLAGKVGKCPHCRAKFEIPFPHEGQDDDDSDGLDDTVTEDPLRDYRPGEQRLAAEAQTAEADLSERMPTPSGSQDWFEALPADADSSLANHIGHWPDTVNSPDQSAASRATAVPPPLPAMPTSLSEQLGARHPLSQIVARLWAEREHGGMVELHLAGGTLLAPEWFDEAGSQGAYGLFASQAADGTVTMTVVPWNEVTRVVVRGVVGLPDGMFE